MTNEELSRCDVTEQPLLMSATLSNGPLVFTRLGGVFACLKSGLFLHFPYDLQGISFTVFSGSMPPTVSTNCPRDTTSGPVLLVWKEATPLKNN